MVTVTTTPSVASSMQHLGALLESMLPMPQTTHMSPTFEIGCTTWAWWPTIRSTAPGTAARASATVCCASTTPWAYSLPQCIDTTTTSAPAASRRLGVGEDHRRVDLVDEPRLVGRLQVAVEPVGVRELRDRDAVDVVRAPAGRPPPPSRAVPACCRPRFVERGERRHHPLLAEVERVVRRHRAAVEPGGGEVARQRAGRAEPGVARERILGSAEGHLEVADRGVGGGQLCRDRRQHRAKS